MQLLNVRKNDIIVVYDKIGMVSAPRAFWMLKAFGIENVAILNGSFNKWIAEGRSVEDGDNDKAWKKIRETKAEPADFNFKFDNTKVKLYEEVVKISNYNLVASDTKGPDSIKIIDSRHQNVHSMGNIPSSLNIPFTAVLN
jgi:thiosulfate/3-mercaptopyruvate sulfurtransferase